MEIIFIIYRSFNLLENRFIALLEVLLIVRFIASTGHCTSTRVRIVIPSFCSAHESRLARHSCKRVDSFGLEIFCPCLRIQCTKPTFISLCFCHIWIAFPFILYTKITQFYNNSHTTLREIIVNLIILMYFILCVEFLLVSSISIFCILL